MTWNLCWPGHLWQENFNQLFLLLRDKCFTYFPFSFVGRISGYDNEIWPLFARKFQLFSASSWPLIYRLPWPLLTFLGFLSVFTWNIRQTCPSNYEMGPWWSNYKLDIWDISKNSQLDVVLMEKWQTKIKNTCSLESLPICPLLFGVSRLPGPSCMGQLDKLQTRRLLDGEIKGQKYFLFDVHRLPGPLFHEMRWSLFFLQDGVLSLLC